MQRFQGNGAWPRAGRGPNYVLTGSTWPQKNLTYSFVPDGTILSSSLTSNMFAQMDLKFGGNRALWISKIEATLTRWSALSGITLTRVTSGGADWDDGVPYSGTTAGGGSSTRGDIRIGGSNIDGQYGILAYAYYPTHGDLVIDTAEDWQYSVNDYRILRNVIGHEFGHSLGLAHVCPWTQEKLMEPYLSEGFAGPQQDDLRGIHELYGDQYEPNNTVATSTPLGTSVMGGATLALGNELASRPNNTSSLSLSQPGDVDYFRFSASARSIATITLTPVGTNYADTPQTMTCDDTSTRTDAQAIKNLVVTVLDSDGVTPLEVSDATAAGTPEVARVALPTSGTYYIKVSATGNVLRTQMYRINVSTEAGRIASGALSFADMGNPAGTAVQIDFRLPGSSTAVWSTTRPAYGAAYAFELGSAVTAGTYDVAMKGTHHLRSIKASVSVGASGIAGLNLSGTLNGDINGDNSVNLNDFSLLSAAYGSTPSMSTWRATSDLNNDLRVNLTDFSILSRDYGRRGTP